MKKRLREDVFFTPQRDFYLLSRLLNNSVSQIWHCHEYYEVELISAGTGIDEINGIPYVLNRGDFIILQPDDYHCVLSYDNNRTELLNIAVSVQMMEEILAFSEIQDPQSLSWPITGKLPHGMTAQITNQAKDLLIPSRQRAQDRGTIKRMMSVFLLCSNIDKKNDINQNIPVWLKQLIEKMKTPEGLNGGIEYLKTQTDYSYPHICRCFQKYLLQTPVEWINEQRLIYSVYLLLNSDQSILDISLECGFHNLSHFNHLFKAFYGVSPKTLRSSV